MQADAAIQVVTFGCRLNTLESEVISRQRPPPALGDAVIVHTCAVTAEAERQARQAIRRLRRERPARASWSPAAAPRSHQSAYAAMAEVDHVVGNAEKLRPETWLQLADVADGTAAASRRHHGRTGADTPSRSTASTAARGPFSRSSKAATIAARSASSPMAAARAGACRRRKSSPRHARCVDGGYRELVRHRCRHRLVWRGTCRASLTLGSAGRACSQRCRELQRLRLSSLDPAAIDTELLDAGRRRAAPDAAPAPLRAGRRRPDAQAHEAAASARPT